MRKKANFVLVGKGFRNSRGNGPIPEERKVKNEQQRNSNCSGLELEDGVKYCIIPFIHQYEL